MGAPESFALEWDRDYGIGHRRGWTVKWNGSVLAELEPFLVVALWKAWRRRRAILKPKETETDIRRGEIRVNQIVPD